MTSMFMITNTHIEDIQIIGVDMTLISLNEVEKKLKKNVYFMRGEASNEI